MKKPAKPEAQKPEAKPVEPIIGSRAPTKLERYRALVLPPDKRAELMQALPRHIKPETFLRNYSNALMQNTALLDTPPEIMFREIAKAAALGLLLDPQLGEGYIIIAWNSRANRMEPQFRIGYRGMIKLARQSGEVKNIYAREVYSKDHFTVRQGIDENIIHEPQIFGERGSIIGYYGVIKFKDDSFDFEPMSVEDCRKVRDRSDGWKAFKAGKIKSTPWATDEGEMSKKTVLRRLLKRQPQSPELMQQALAQEDEAEFAEPRDITPALSPVRDRLDGAIGKGEGMQHHVGNDVRDALRESRAVTTIDQGQESPEFESPKISSEPSAAAAPNLPAADVAAAGVAASSPAATGAGTASQAASPAPPTSQPQENAAPSQAQSSIGEAQGTGPPTDSPPDPKLVEARLRGRQAFRDGFKKRAIPPEYRAKGGLMLADQWSAGWQEEADLAEDMFR
jgi:recombination protein RecT